MGLKGQEERARRCRRIQESNLNRMSEQTALARGYLPGGESLGGESARSQNKKMTFPLWVEIKRLLISASVCFLADAYGLKLWQHYGQAPCIISLFVSFCPYAPGVCVVDGVFFIQGNGPT